jgi:flagellar motor switch protein FliN/FliY
MAEGANPPPADPSQVSGNAAGGDSTSSTGPLLEQSAIEALLAGATDVNLEPPAASRPSPSNPTQSGAAKGGKGQPVSGLAKGDIDYLLSQAEQALASLNNPVDSTSGAPVQPYKLTDFAASAPSTEAATLDLIRDVELDLKIELGRSQMYLEDVLKLRKGSVVPLDKLAGDPVDVYVNGRLIARGEVLVLNDNFCVRVAELIASEQVA